MDELSAIDARHGAADNQRVGSAVNSRAPFAATGTPFPLMYPPSQVLADSHGVQPAPSWQHIGAGRPATAERFAESTPHPEVCEVPYGNPLTTPLRRPSPSTERNVRRNSGPMDASTNWSQGPREHYTQGIHPGTWDSTWTRTEHTGIEAAQIGSQKFQHHLHERDHAIPYATEPPLQYSEHDMRSTLPYDSRFDSAHRFERGPNAQYSMAMTYPENPQEEHYPGGGSSQHADIPMQHSQVPSGLPAEPLPQRPLDYPVPLGLGSGLPVVKNGAFVSNRARRFMVAHGEQLLSGAMHVRDAADNSEVFIVKRRLVPFDSRRTLCDAASGLPLLSIGSAREAGIGEALAICDVFGPAPQEPLFTMRKRSRSGGRVVEARTPYRKKQEYSRERSSFIKPELPPAALTAKLVAKGKTVRVRGARSNHVADIVMNTVSLKNLTTSRVGYFVTVSPGYDTAVVVATCVGLHEMLS